MDTLSLLIAFLSGTATGAAGTYFAEKFTDKRRSMEATSKADEEWKDLERRFPKIIAEMKDDVRKPENVSVRRFFVKSSKTIVNTSERSFSYFTDTHSDINAAVAHLIELGYIEDITPGNCPLYRMKEHFIDRLRQP